jgi:hypothetical protein
MSQRTLERERRDEKQIKGEDQHKWTWRFVSRGSVQKNLLPVEEATKARSISTLSLSLSIGHLERSSAFSQSHGSLRPHKDHHTIRCLLLALTNT